MPFPDVLAGREQGHKLQGVYCNAKKPHISISPAAHAYVTDQAWKRANRTPLRIPMRAGQPSPTALNLAIVKAGWFADLGTFNRKYERVCRTPKTCQALAIMVA